MQVVVLRHGIAQDRTDANCPPERERPLTAEGVGRAREAVRGLAVLGIKPVVIVSSPLVRAVQTAELAAQGLACADVRQSEALAGGIQVDAIFELLAGLQDLGTVVCVGHAPQLDVFLLRAIGARSQSLAPLKKAGAACVAFDLVAPGQGRLVWFLEPKALRQLGRA